MTIVAKHATESRVAAFGSVVSSPSGRPTSSGEGYKFWSDLAHYRIEGETEIGICTVFARPGAAVDAMERHMKTPEILVPIDAPFVVPLMLDGEGTRQAEVFRVNPGEAIVIADGVWHGACLPVGRDESSYFVIFRRGTPKDDVQKKVIPPFKIETE